MISRWIQLKNLLFVPASAKESLIFFQLSLDFIFVCHAGEEQQTIGKTPFESSFIIPPASCPDDLAVRL